MSYTESKIRRQHGEMYDYQPGNGTRYYLAATKIVGPDGPMVLVAWLWRGDTAGPSMAFRPGEEYDLGYVARKLRIADADAAAILVFARDIMGVDVCIGPDYDSETGLHKSRL